jgi:hypothetical protein
LKEQIAQAERLALPEQPPSIYDGIIRELEDDLIELGTAVDDQLEAIDIERDKLRRFSTMMYDKRKLLAVMQAHRAEELAEAPRK